MSSSIDNDNVVYPEFGHSPDLDDSWLNPGDNSVSVSSWTSEDFAKVYVKYRPRLESYARKFLRDQTEVDEVIQDAFMYLFLSQPELDSEVGVLKFLQWKTRLLCLDIMRVQGRRPLTVLDDAENYDLKLDSHMSAENEYDKMFDVAIVHAALSRIPDRQREALIRAEFGEQSAAEIGAELGVSENAVRQLLMRARRSFRTELIEQVNIAGIDVSEILSVAVRKAKEISKNAGAMIIAMIVPLAMIFGFQYASSNQSGVVVVEPESKPSVLPIPDDTQSPSEIPSVNPKPSTSTTPNSKPSTDSAQLLQDGVISRKSEFIETSPTLIMSEFPLNAEGTVASTSDPSVTTAILTSLEGDKVEVIVTRNESRIEISFKLLARGSSTWQVVEVVELERTLTTSGGLVVNAVLKDSEGKEWGVSTSFSADFATIQSARIVGI